MRKSAILLLIALFLLFITVVQSAQLRVWAFGEQTNPATVLAQDGIPTEQPAGQFLTGPTAGDPLAIALDYLQREAAKLGLTADDLADMVVTDRYVTQRTGVTHLFLQQRYHGITVFNAVINVNISRNGAVINLGNRFVGHLAQAVNTDTPTLTAVDAVAHAAQALQWTLTAPPEVIEAHAGPEQVLRLRASGLAQEPVSAKLVYARQGVGKVRLAWSLLIEPLTDQHYWHLQVDAITGALLAQNDLVLSDRGPVVSGDDERPDQPPITAAPVASEQSAAKQPASPLTPPTYRVVPLPLEHPNDGPGLPDSQALIDTPADELASPYGWHDIDGTPGHEFNDTRGNNVSAQEDRNGDDSDGFRPTGVKPRKFNFDYRLDPQLEPTADPNTTAAIVNLFYWSNILHDLSYHYGFDEVSGNFQENTYGRGGLGGDAVQADVQDGYDLGARNNAYFVITPDGEPSRLGMFVFDYTTPGRDSAFDNGIIAHEYAHGISTRLVGGPSNPYCLYNGEQMGEGWSDWFALALTTKAEDNGRAPHGLGTYALGQPPAASGFRRYPYSTDLAIDPFTYADLVSTGGDIYLIGQVWSSMLWELQWNFIDQYGFDSDLYAGSGGNNQALRLVIDGMKLAPCEPGFVDARDAILTADQIDTDGVNICTIWRAFAKRGLGVSAQQGSPYDFADGVAAFDLPIACRDDLSMAKVGAPDPVAAGDVLTYTISASNYTDQPLTGGLLRDPLPAHTTYVADSASDGGRETGGVVSWPLPPLNPDESVTRTFQVTVDRIFPDPEAIYVDEMENGGETWTATGLWHLQSDGDACGNSFSPTHSWYYGAAPSCSYTDASSGELTMVNPVALPHGNVTLKFMSWEDYETCCDLPEVLVSTDGVDFRRIWNATAANSHWHEVSVDLSAYGGQSIWLRFTFQSDYSVTYTGWYVDDVRLIVVEGLVNNATLTTAEGVTATVTSMVQVYKAPEIVVVPAAFDETLLTGTVLNRTLTITDVGTAPLSFSLLKVATAAAQQAQTVLPPRLSDVPTNPMALSYAGDRLIPHPDQKLTPSPKGLTGETHANVLLLAAADVYQLQSILRAYPDLGQIDYYDARYGTPTLAEAMAYATVIVISNNPFASPYAVGDLLADYVDSGGTVIQSVATFYDPAGIGWGLRGRFADEGYSPFSGTGDWFSFAELGDFDATHPIMLGVTTAGDSMRQVVDLTPGTQWVASWTDDEFVATKGRVVALNTFLADGYNWVGDIPLIVHNSIVWLQNSGAESVPWLTATPLTGTLGVGESQAVQLTFDASSTALTQAGDYTATLKILSNDPRNRSVDVAIVMHALGPEVSIGTLPGYFGRTVALPVNFAGNELPTAAAAFSLDIDESCLRFDPTDANNNGIPDAIKPHLPPGFELVAHTNISDTAGELDLFIGDLTPPITTLPDGLLLTLDLQAICLPPAGPLPVRVGFGAAPPASFSDPNGMTLLGKLTAGAVAIQSNLAGDCNQDGLVNAADAVSCVLEIFDGDGSFWLDAPGGSFPGSPHGCDSNLDERIDAGDILCTVLTIFEGQGACNNAVRAADAQAVTAATLAIPAMISAQPGGTVTVPVNLTGNGNMLGAAVFTLAYDPAYLQLAQTDRDGNGSPDAIAFTVPAGLMTSATVVDNRRIEFVIADLSLPLVTLPDGPLATITFTVNPQSGEQAQTTAIRFAGAVPASLGNHAGQSTAVTTVDGAVVIAGMNRAEALTETVYLPFITR